MLRFKGYCAEHNIKQKEIAELLDITLENVNAKMNGRLEFTLAQVKTLCNHFNISADYYFLSQDCEKATEETDEGQQ